MLYSTPLYGAVVPANRRYTKVVLAPEAVYTPWGDGGRREDVGGQPLLRGGYNFIEISFCLHRSSRYSSTRGVGVVFVCHVYMEAVRSCSLIL